MRDSVRAAFVPFTSRLEGVVNHCYCDVLGLVSTGIGNLIDPISLALPLPFLRDDGLRATQDEIRAEWQNVKAHQDMRWRGGRAYRTITTLHLADDAIASLVQHKLWENETNLIGRFPEFESWRADAQLGLLSMAWAAGAGLRFPKFEAACKALDFAEAAAECHLEDSRNPGLRPRNVANRTLFENAAYAQAAGLDPDILFYPQVLTPAA